MDEIEKLYENANVRKYWNSTPDFGIEEYYPPFSAEKQIELIIWLSKTNHSISINSNGNELSIETFYEDCTEGFRDLSDALASITNILWQILTSEEKQQIKEILE